MIEVFNNQVIMNYAKPGALNNNSNDEVYLYDGFHGHLQVVDLFRITSNIFRCVHPVEDYWLQIHTI